MFDPASRLQGDISDGSPSVVENCVADENLSPKWSGSPDTDVDCSTGSRRWFVGSFFKVDGDGTPSRFSPFGIVI